MEKFDVVILTERKYIDPSECNDYIDNVILEDKIVQEALEKKGVKTIKLSWDDPNFDWSQTKFILFRTTWDYHSRFQEFSEWLSIVSSKTKLINSEEIIRWNIDKHYLQDLENNGVHICESYFIEKGISISLKELSITNKLSEFVLKPCVSAGGRNTYKINKDTLNDYEKEFKKLISEESYILQPFQHNIVEKGEISLILIDGKYTHAVLKTAKKGDFRVQDDFGGTVQNYTPTQEEIDFAEKAVLACKELPLYARVDIFTDNNNKIALAELELIEPELWFRNHKEAADHLAQSIKNLID